MSLVDEAIPSSHIFQQLKEAFDGLNDADKKKQMEASKGIFQLNVKKGAKEGAWTIDMKKGVVSKGTAKPKADCIISTSDETFTDLAQGKISGQKAFMSGKIKVKGNIMMATKLDGLLALGKPKSKL